MPESKLKIKSARFAKREKLKVNGFSLIEIMIVITIIGILAVIAAVSYQSLAKSARDAKRQTDLKIIQSALEQYHADQHFYPPPENGITTDFIGQQITNATGQSPAPPVTKVYLNISPSETGGGSTYAYLPLPVIGSVPGGGCSQFTPSQCSDYCLCSKLENLAAPLIPSSCGVWLPAGSPYNYCVTKP